MDIDNLIIEVTRKCNMTCEHCLRGEAENLVFNVEFFREFVTTNKVHYIRAITFTGGEPSLHPEIIIEVLEICEVYGVDIGSFYIATNGIRHLKSDDFIIAITRLWCFCIDNECSGVALSVDNYHDTIQGESMEDTLSIFKFFSVKHCPTDVSYMLNEGMFKENYDCGRDVERSKIDVDECIEHNSLLDVETYLNCKGNVVLGCDWSSENQDNNVLCSYDVKITEDVLIKFNEVEK